MNIISPVNLNLSNFTKEHDYIYLVFNRGFM